MILISYTRYCSKDGSKKGAFINLGEEIQRSTDVGYECHRFWAPYDLPVTKDMALRKVDVEFAFGKDKNGNDVTRVKSIKLANR